MVSTGPGIGGIDNTTSTAIDRANMESLLWPKGFRSKLRYRCSSSANTERSKWQSIASHNARA